MTFSVVARCPRTGAFGIAAATGIPGVGKLLTHAHASVGAVATQALLNPNLGIDALTLLGTPDRAGLGAREALDEALGVDPDASYRQLAVVDRHGQIAVHTGSATLDWAGDRGGDGYAIQGNLLTGPDVLEAAEDSFLAAHGEPLERRLLLALEAGEHAGGDRRGTRSATIYCVENADYPVWDIRVDEHADPLGELRRLFEIFQDELIMHIRRMPGRGDRHPSSDRGWHC